MLWIVAPQSAAGQRDTLSYFLDTGETVELTIDRSRGFPAVPWRSLEPVGWSVEQDGARVAARSERDDLALSIEVGNPFFQLGGQIVQLWEQPYVVEQDLFIPLQLLTDLLPARLPNRLDYRPEARTLVVRPDRASGFTERSLPTDEPLVIIVDAGHGGRDAGASGPGGVREKDVALSVALMLEEELAKYPGLEVHMTRTDDTLIPIWSRGEMATEWRADRPGVFLSIHANSLPDRPEVRGFETYFLAPARTEHERRVAAIENAPVRFESEEDPGVSENPELGLIFRELRNLDQQHWSALLASLIQGELAEVHPGLNRGVKQGELAVLTNALMPAVLVEVGFISHPEESRILAQDDFQRAAAQSIVEALRAFFERYPPS